MFTYKYTHTPTHTHHRTHTHTHTHTFKHYTTINRIYTIMISLFEFSFATTFMAPPLWMIISIKCSISTNNTFARTQRYSMLRYRTTHRISCYSLLLQWERQSTFSYYKKQYWTYWSTWMWSCTKINCSGEILYWVTSLPTLLTLLTM